MEPDFSGWATKAGLKCTDGKTIMAGAFKHQDQTQVPLVWQHGHSDPENILGHVLLHNREEGVYCDAFFNDSAKAQHAKGAVQHKDINSLSIWANDLILRSGMVLHGAIREVSLVLARANPGALIDNIIIKHSDDGEEDEVLQDEAIIFTGLELELEHAAAGSKDETIQDVLDTFDEKQRNVFDYLIGQALDTSPSVGQSALTTDDPKLQAVFESMTEDQQSLLHSMVTEAKGKAEVKSTIIESKGTTTDEKGTTVEVKHNVFEEKAKETSNGRKEQVVLSHDALKGITDEAKKPGNTLKSALEDYCIAHGIQDIDILFPEARVVDGTPEWFSRRMEWVGKVLSGVRKSPFSRIKSMSADITVQEARAKGYIKGTLKKEEFFRLSKRETTPKTIYKKQKLDRDDIIDITDLDVVAWMKSEMRIMLDEEIARAILLGDGRPVDHEDKISEDNVRPIATDHEVYTTKLYVNIDDSQSSMTEIIDQIALHRSDLRGSGSPTMFTTEYYISRMLLIKDSTGRKIYRNIDELKTDMRVSEIVAVEVMEEYEDIVAVLVNLQDYVVGADKGGNVAMFDDFDIDYNQFKYLIETRISGALVKLKSAMAVLKTAGANVLVVPAPPAFNPVTNEVSIVNQAGVVYRNKTTDAVMNAAGSPYPVAPDTTLTVVATPAAGKYFESSDNDEWSFTNNG